MLLTVRTDEFEMELHLSKGKGAFWHGDDGVLAMGVPEESRQRTVYCSYTNMPTTGQLAWNQPSGRAFVLEVGGQSWFDRH
jgi:predicted secreted hydrolase